jgi:hypothetical protein
MRPKSLFIPVVRTLLFLPLIRAVVADLAEAITECADGEEAVADAPLNVAGGKYRTTYIEI